MPAFYCISEKEISMIVIIIKEKKFFETFTKVWEKRVEKLIFYFA